MNALGERKDEQVVILTRGELEQKRAELWKVMHGFIISKGTLEALARGLKRSGIPYLASLAENLARDMDEKVMVMSAILNRIQKWEIRK